MKTPIKIWRIVFLCGILLFIISDIQDPLFNIARLLISVVMFGGMIYLNCMIQGGNLRIHMPYTSRRKCREAYEKLQSWLREQDGVIHWKDAPISAFKSSFEEHLSNYPEERKLEETRRWQALYKWLDSEVGPRRKVFSDD